MTIDIARASFNAKRPWRAVLAQQGRVTLEADINEQVAIDAAAARAETIDIIGRIGTPDGGYQLSVSGNAVNISRGTIYLGGWRLTLPKAITTADQPGWLDMPAWPAPQGNQIIALLAIEQTVTAVEDHSLREVALGGPDSAGRLTLLQHVLEIPSAADDCASAAAALGKLLLSDGLTLDAADCSLTGTARLRVSTVEAASNAGACDPPATGGYLGADNQMIRVTITALSAAGGTLVWGWNNASFLFRATVGSDTTLILTSDPLDPDHTPQAGQIVEVLRCTVDLGDGNQAVDGGGNFIAAGDGKMFVLGANPYAAATRQLTLSASLADPPDYTGDGKRPLFVRLWTQRKDFVSGTKTPLGDTGIAVTITEPSLPSIGGRPFWHFAVRPLTPQAVYPERYLHGPQPPDGPKACLAPLGIIGGNAESTTLVEDCSISFLPLTRQKGCDCCCVVMTPDEVKQHGGLQKVVASLGRGPAVLSLLPGIYALDAPLRLTDENAQLTLESCAGDVILRAAEEVEEGFSLGLIQLDGANGVTLRGLTFIAPLTRQSFLAGDNVTVFTSCCVTIRAARRLTVQDCGFLLNGDAKLMFGVGLFVVGTAADCTLRQNRFAGSGDAGSLIGVMALVDGKNVLTAMDNWDIAENTFGDLAGAMFCLGQFGLLRCRGNVVTSCQDGFLFVDANLGAPLAFNQAALADNTQARDVNLGSVSSAALRPEMIVKRIDQAAPLLAALPVAPPAPAVSELARKVLADQLKSSGDATYKSVSAKLAPPAAQAPQAAAEKTTAPADAAVYSRLTDISVSVETRDEKLTPALRFEDNEITLTAASVHVTYGADHAEINDSGGGSGFYASAGSALMVVLSPSNPGSVIVNANRAVVPDSTFSACTLMFPAAAVVSGNLFVQLALAPRYQYQSGNTPCLVLIADSPAIMVGANVASFSSYILPAAAAPTGVTSWQLLNTTVALS